jgi:hypothetical protein
VNNGNARILIMSVKRGFLRSGGIVVCEYLHKELS